MGWLIMIATTVGGVLLAAIASQLAFEFRDWTPRWTDWLVDKAVRSLPTDLQERMAEEWRGFIFDTPGHIAKLARAVGLLFAAKQINLEMSDSNLLDHVTARATIIAGVLLTAPLVGVLALALAVRGGQILEKDDEQRFYRFRMGDDELSRFMRRARMDDLPSLWNYARGDAIVRCSEIVTAIKRAFFYRE